MYEIFENGFWNPFFTTEEEFNAYYQNTSQLSSFIKEEYAYYVCLPKEGIARTIRRKVQPKHYWKVEYISDYKWYEHHSLLPFSEFDPLSDKRWHGETVQRFFDGDNVLLVTNFPSKNTHNAEVNIYKFTKITKEE